MRIDTGEEMGASICHPDTSQWKLLLSLVGKVDPLCTQKERLPAVAHLVMGKIYEPADKKKL